MADPSSSYRPNPLAIASLVGHNGLQQDDHHFTMDDLTDAQFDTSHAVVVGSHSPLHNGVDHLPMDDGNFDSQLEPSSSKAGGAGLLAGNSKQGQKQPQDQRPKKQVWVPPPTFPYNLIPGRDLSAPLQSQTMLSSSFKDFQPKPPKGPRKSTSKKKKAPRESDDEDLQDMDDSLMLPHGNGMNEETLDGMLKMDVDFDDEAMSTVVPVPPSKKKEKAKSTVKQSAHPSPASASKTGGRAKTEKSRALEQEKEDKERLKAEKSTTKSSSKSKNASSSSKDASKAKAGSGSFASNQGVRVDGARNAVVEEMYDDEEIEEEVVDTHLYCICKQLYDDDRVMIACDNCDEWYHPKCVGLIEEDLELVDMFICPPCIAQNPNLQTTYKVSCVQCRRPARLPLSKFCSDECGIQCVMDRVDKLSASLVDSPVQPSEWVDRLYESNAIRSAKRREGLVSLVEKSRLGSEDAQRDAKHEEEERTLTRLRKIINDLGSQRRGKMRKVAALDARLILLEVAAKRTESQGFEGRCGYDTRIGKDEGEWEDWVESEDGRKAFEGFGETEEDAEMEREELKKWICEGRKKCERHSGWQKLKRADIELERDVLQRAIQKLKTRERDLRTRVEDILALRTPPGSVAGKGDVATQVVEPATLGPELNGINHNDEHHDMETDTKLDDQKPMMDIKKSTSPIPDLSSHLANSELHVNGIKPQMMDQTVPYTSPPNDFTDMHQFISDQPI
ncbi:hypothetical protein FRC02_009438 [Tulasnella sp. 418]|nr:hypothetical protein FRC02_009438 [Tulasnella sp. 418]